MEKQIFQKIEKQREEIIKFLQHLLQVDTSVIQHGIKGKEKKGQEFIQERFQKIGLEIDTFEPDNASISKFKQFTPNHSYSGRPNVVGIYKGKKKGHSLILNGHIDTVPIGEKDSWKVSPFSGKIVKDRIYGRGASDMKSGLAAMIMAVEILLKLGYKPENDVIIESVVDEEGGGNGTLSCIERGYRADIALVAEPTQLEICPVSMGTCLVEVIAKGKPTHCCIHWKGINAIEECLKIHNGLKKLEQRWKLIWNHPFLPSPSIILGKISGGTVATIIPENCSLKYDIHYPPKGKNGRVDFQMVKNEFEQYVRELIQRDNWLKNYPPYFNWYQNVEPSEMDPNHPFIKYILNVSRRVKKNSKISGFPTGCDSRLLANVGGIPTVIFGPGNLIQAHGIDEYVLIEDYINAVKILALVIYKWTSS